MPLLDQFGSLIEKLKADEEARIMQERDMAIQQARQAQAQPSMSGQAIPQLPMGQGIPGFESIGQAEEYIKQHPAPTRTLGERLGQGALGFGLGMLGVKYRPPTLTDPLKSFREKVAEAIVNQGMQGAQQEKLEGIKQQNRIGMLGQKAPYDINLKQTPPGIHPSQERLNEANARAAEAGIGFKQQGQALKEKEYGLKERQFQDIEKPRLGIETARQKMDEITAIINNLSTEEKIALDKARLNIDQGRTNVQNYTDIEKLALEEKRLSNEINKTTSDIGRTDVLNKQTNQEIAQKEFGNKFARKVIKDATGFEEVPFDQAMDEIKKGAPFNTSTNAEGVEAGMSSTANAPTSKGKSNDYEYGTDISITPEGGTQINLKERLTREAQQKDIVNKAIMQRMQQPIDESTAKNLELGLSAYNTTQRMKSLYSPDQLGVIANIWPSYLKYGQVDKKHFAMRGELAELKAALGFLRSGSNISGIEQELQDDILPNLSTGKPENFMYALNRVSERLKTSLLTRSKLVSAGRSDIPGIVQQGMETTNQQNPSSSAYNQMNQPPYPKGAPAGLQYDPNIGKWRMP